MQVIEWHDNHLISQPTDVYAKGNGTTHSAFASRCCYDCTCFTDFYMIFTNPKI